MSKADRRKRAGRKAKADVLREPNGRENRSASAKRMEEYVREARARKSKITGRDDLPIDVLGILYGHDCIGDAEYNIGRKLESVMARIYGAPNESPSAMFKEAVSPPNAEDAVSPASDPMSDQAVEALFMRMDQTLRRCGMSVRDLTIGAVRYCRYPQTKEHVAFICEGLVALAKGHAPKMKSGHGSLREAA